MADYDERIFLARVAELADRYEDMVTHLEEAAKLKTDDFNSEERNLISVGFKNLVGSRRSALRSIGGIEQNAKYAHFSEGLKGYKTRIENELYDQCIRIINLINNSILGKAGDNKESKAFFLKMIGDYYRYIAESAHDDRLKEVSDAALQFYDKASTAADELAKYNPIRLGLALNFSVFHFEVRNDKSKAIEVA